MNQLKKIKEQLYQRLHELLEEKIDEATRAIETAKEARDNDTKSTAGDKYETGRAMMQIEMENGDRQLNKAIELQKALAQLNINKGYDKIEPGSLVATNNGNYFISIGIGKVKVDNDVNYAISLASPLGQALKDKTVGEKINFNGRRYIIEKIV